MQLPLQITFRDIPHSDAVENNIRAKVAKLDKYFPSVMNCRVVVEAPHLHHHKGRLYHVRIDITVPDGELVVSRDAGKDHSHEDVYVAIRDAFEAAYRQLKSYRNKLRRHVKTHVAPPHGRVAAIYPEQGFGHIASSDGRDVYFHENSVIDGRFAALEPGAEVRFSAEMGEMGPQASSVHVVGKHHILP